MNYHQKRPIHKIWLRWPLHGRRYRCFQLIRPLFEKFRVKVEKIILRTGNNIDTIY